MTKILNSFQFVAKNVQKCQFLLRNHQTADLFQEGVLNL